MNSGVSKRRLAELLRGLRYKILDGRKDVEITGVSDDSRDIKEGYLFIAVKGENNDGHNYIFDAVRNGAVAVVAEHLPSGISVDGVTFVRVEDSRAVLNSVAAEWYGHPSKRSACIGITGTNGKTTTSLLIHHILNECGVLTDVAGTLFYKVAGRSCPSSNTTPGAMILQRLLAESVAAGGEAFVMEVSSHALAQRRTDAVSFSGAVLTNIGSDHLDYHRTHKEYIEAKKRLFKTLKSDSLAVINRDTPHWREFAECCRCAVVTYSMHRRNATVTADATIEGFNGIGLKVNVYEDEKEFILPLIGLHNGENALAALSICYFVFGLPLSEITDALREFKGVPGRLEVVTDETVPFKVVVDYAHTEDALFSALNALRPLTERRLMVVFGCGGERDSSKRPRMGKVAELCADFAIVTSDNPRNEDPYKIIDGICRGFSHEEKYTVIADRREAIRTAVSMARPGDVLLIAGKGHETCQIISNRVLPFDDRTVVREVMRDVA